MKKNFFLLSILICSVFTFSAHAADMDDMAGMDMSQDHADMQHDENSHMEMKGFYGPYKMNREASGTSWVPESSPMYMATGMYDGWMGMADGYANLVYDHQGGKRGDEKTFSESMLMGMASHPLGDGTIGVRTMLSLDPLMGKGGYPLLFQTGETANGLDHLVDRQHPHDLFMELATTYSHPITKESSAFVYLGYPGEPALGPATFMHRFSGMDNPEAPIDHHWLDSTHITYGVATLGYIWRNWKIEGSAFNGREPDQYRWNFDDPRFSSFSGRLSYNPTDNWSLQVSKGYIKSPEQLEPDVDQRRVTASAIYNRPFGKENNWQTTFAWGNNDNHPGNSSNAYLLESAVKFYQTHTFFGRIENVDKDELFDTGTALDTTIYNVSKFSLGYVYDMPLATHLALGFGGVGSLYKFPETLDPVYSKDPASMTLFTRLLIR